MRSQRVAKVILVSPENSVWMARRNADDDNRAGQWDLFGGGGDRVLKIFKESFRRTAVRELFEEGGLSVPRRALEPVYAETTVRDFIEGPTRVQGRYFATRTDAVAGDFRLTEHDAVQLFTLPEAIDVAYERQRRIFEYLQQHQILERLP